LGVFVCEFPPRRGVQAGSACAARWRPGLPKSPGSILFCSPFSQNRRQLLCRSTRRHPCASTACACVEVSGRLSRLDGQPSISNTEVTSSAACLLPLACQFREHPPPIRPSPLQREPIHLALNRDRHLVAPLIVEHPALPRHRHDPVA